MKYLAFILLLLALPLAALEPSEMLQDPVLEARARALDHQLRCVVCQSEALASSNANWAEDARRTSRELIAGGATDEEVLAFFVDRYGEFVLMSPNTKGANWLLWAVGPVGLLIASGLGFVYVRGRAATPPPVDVLSDSERARLKEILKD